MTSYTYGGAHAIPAVDDEARRFVPSRGGMGVGGEGSGRGGFSISLGSSLEARQLSKLNFGLLDFTGILGLLQVRAPFRQ